MDHEQITNQNRTAWEFQSYEAWVSAYGTPILAAAELVRDHLFLEMRLPLYVDVACSGSQSKSRAIGR